MDKFFIQNAFKTLDEIEEEMKADKKPLKEAVEKREEEKLDADELSDKYVGKKFNFCGDIIEIIKLINFGDDFGSSIWEVINLDGKKCKIKGAELKSENGLNEQLPRDLAKAYSNITAGNQKMKRNSGETQYVADSRRKNYFPGNMVRRHVAIDFANSNYEDISNEDRKAIIKEYEGKKYKLRLLFNSRYPNEKYYVIMWDKDGNQLTSTSELRDSVLDDSPLRSVKHDHFSFSELVRYADKIYVTDEDKHLTGKEVSPSILDTPEKQEINKLRKKYLDMTGWGDESRPVLNSATDLLIDDSSENPDTGSHTYNKTKTSGYKRWFDDAQDKYYRMKKDGTGDIDYWLDELKRYQYRYNAVKRHDDTRGNKINYELLRYKLLKAILKKEGENFLQIRDGLEGTLYAHPYAAAIIRKKQLESEINKLLREIKDRQAEIAQLGNDLSDESKHDFEEMKNDKLDALMNDYYDVAKEFNYYRRKLGKEEIVRESIDNVSDNNYLRIYTKDVDGREEFIDDFNTAGEAKQKYGELAEDPNYEQVCLVEIDGDDTYILYDSAENDLEEEIKDKRSIGQIVDDKLKNEELEKDKLTESKSFNLKDENDIIDANVYKKVGGESEDELVVVDPSVESKDDGFQPHVGDAILQCKSCKTPIFKKTDDLVKDKNSDVYNIEMDCPHCGAKTGFIYIGQVALKNVADDVEGEKPGEDTEVEIKEEPKVEEEKGSLPEVKDNYVDLGELDEVKEESFERLVNPYLTKLYENVDRFKTTNIEQTGRNTIKIEGKLISKSGKEKLVEFLFKTKENGANSIVLEGYNKILTNQENAFKIKGNVENKELVFESFEYNYNKEVGGKQVLIEGIEK